MKKIDILKEQKQIFERLLKEINERTKQHFTIIYKDYTIELQKNGVHLHSFIEAYDDPEMSTAARNAYYYIKALQENL